MSQQLNLTRPQKAAAILVAIGKPAAGRLLKFFKQEELRVLIEGARSLRTIPQGELEKIVAEFEAEFAEGAGLLDSADRMDTLLNESLTPEEMNAIMGQEQQAPLSDNEASIWPQVETLDPAELGAFVMGEHPQTAALVLSSLSSEAAAKVLLTLAKPVRGEIVKRMLSMRAVAAGARQLLENQIGARLLRDTSAKASSAGQERVASVLNELDKSELDEVMEDLASAGASDLHTIRARLFAFEDVVLLEQKARVTLFDGISTEMVTLALRNATPELVEAVLSAIGARSRRMIESELASDPGNTQAAEITKARKAISATALRLASEGKLELPSVQAAA